MFCSSAAQVQPAEQHFEQSHTFLYFTDAVLLKVLQIREIALVCTFFFKLKVCCFFLPQVSPTLFFKLQHQQNIRVEIYSRAKPRDPKS